MGATVEVAARKASADPSNPFPNCVSLPCPSWSLALVHPNAAPAAISWHFGINYSQILFNFSSVGEKKEKKNHAQPLAWETTGNTRVAIICRIVHRELGSCSRMSCMLITGAVCGWRGIFLCSHWGSLQLLNSFHVFPVGRCFFFLLPTEFYTNPLICNLSHVALV